MSNPAMDDGPGPRIEALRFIRAMFDEQHGAGFDLTEDAVRALAAQAIGTMSALAVRDGCGEPEEIRAYVSRMIDGQLGDLMLQEP